MRAPTSTLPCTIPNTPHVVALDVVEVREVEEVVVAPAQLVGDAARLRMPPVVVVVVRITYHTSKGGGTWGVEEGVVGDGTKAASAGLSGRRGAAPAVPAVGAPPLRL